MESLPKDLQRLLRFQKTSELYHLLYLDNVSSTNDAAQKLARDNCPHGTVIIADSQSEGRGRHGREWFSPPGQNIYMTLILRPEKLPFSYTLISVTASLAAVEAIHGLDLSEADRAGSIWPKWPNDIYYGEKKLGGILAEASIAGERTNFMIVGMGLNVNMGRDAVPASLQETATSLCLMTGKTFERGLLIEGILKSFQAHYDMLFRDPSHVIDSWCSLSRTVNSRVKAATPRGDLSGTAVGLDHRGYLRIRKDDGSEITVSSADITHMRENGSL